MILNIERDKKYEDKVIATDIHGKYPYKLYLEVKGNSNIGRYIVVVSEKQLNKDNKVEKISIKLDTNGKKAPKKESNTTIVKPNTVKDGYYITYNVKEASVLDVGNIPILVYRAEKKRRSLT
jgi:hypothetical protein